MPNGAVSVSPSSTVTSSAGMPSSWATIWAQVRAELAALPAAPKLGTPDPWPTLRQQLEAAASALRGELESAAQENVAAAATPQEGEAKPPDPGQDSNL